MMSPNEQQTNEHKESTMSSRRGATPKMDVRLRSPHPHAAGQRGGGITARKRYVSNRPPTEERDQLLSYEDGANSLVRKSLDLAEFAETVVCMGVYWLAVNKPAGSIGHE